MSSRRSSSISKDDVVFPRILFCDSRCSQTLTGLLPVLPGALLCNAISRLGDGQGVIPRQRVRGSVRSVRAVRNTWVFQMETRVVADVPRAQDIPSTAYTNYSMHHVQHTPSTAYTKYSIHQVQNAPSIEYTSTASSYDGLSSLYSLDHELTPECSFSLQHGSLHNPPLSPKLSLRAHG
jgi:hypothetical protein